MQGYKGVNQISLIPAEYLRSIVSIGVMNNESSINWIGTGFFVFRCIGSDQLLPFMVTNKHVLQGHETVYIRLKKENSDELETVKVELEKMERSAILNIQIKMLMLQLFVYLVTILNNKNLNLWGLISIMAH